MDVSRRQLLGAGLVGSAALFLPVQPVLAQPRIDDRLPESRIPAPFQRPLPTIPTAKKLRHPDTTTDYYRIDMIRADRQILPTPDFPPTMIFGYDGITPGPTIRARRNRDVVVRFVNRLPARHPTLRYDCTTSVHLHGNASAPEFDGWAEDVSRPGFFKDYLYPNRQDERMMWYHDHAVHHTAENTYMGLAGLYITDEGLDLPLPKGEFEVPLVIQDKIFDTRGQFLYDDDGQDQVDGDVILVNGAPQPFLEVLPRKYLFRILNASSSRSYRLALSTGAAFTFVSGDGGLNPVPQHAPSFRMAPAERYGVVIDFAESRNRAVVLRNLELDNNEDYPSTRQVLQFRVLDEDVTDDSSVPDRLNRSRDAHNPMLLDPATASRTRNFRFERTNGQWAVNARFWDPRRMEATPRHEDVEIWRFENRSGGWFHPIHTHLIDFRILDRNGRAPFAYERGPKDTVYLGENETVRVIARFGPQDGRYMMHCHNVVHEDHDMMVAFQVGNDATDPAAIARPRPNAAVGTPIVKPTTSLV